LSWAEATIAHYLLINNDFNKKKFHKFFDTYIYELKDSTILVCDGKDLQTSSCARLSEVLLGRNDVERETQLDDEK